MEIMVTVCFHFVCHFVYFFHYIRKVFIQCEQSQFKISWIISVLR